MSTLDKQSKKNRKNLILHVDVEITLGTIAAILWLNIPGLGGKIVGALVLTIMILYIFLVYRPDSRFNLWIDKVLHQINLKSLTRKPKSRAYGIVMFSVGFTDVIAYLILYHVIGFYALACLCMMVGSVVKFIGLFAIYRATQSPKGQIFMMYAIMFGIWVIGSQLLYFTILLFTHI